MCIWYSHPALFWYTAWIVTPCGHSEPPLLLAIVDLRCPRQHHAQPCTHLSQLFFCLKYYRRKKKLGQLGMRLQDACTHVKQTVPLTKQGICVKVFLQYNEVLLGSCPGSICSESNKITMVHIHIPYAGTLCHFVSSITCKKKLGVELRIFHVCTYKPQ